jgi:hypothetical protein
MLKMLKRVVSKLNPPHTEGIAELPRGTRPPIYPNNVMENPVAAMSWIIKLLAIQPLDAPKPIPFDIDAVIAPRSSKNPYPRKRDGGIRLLY